MRTDRRNVLLALVASGLLWGTTVPLTKVALAGWGPAWLTVARFGLAALPLLWLGRRHAARRPVDVDGAVGRVRLRRGDGPAERRHRAHQRQPRGAGDRHDAGPGGAARPSAWAGPGSARCPGPASRSPWPASASSARTAAARPAWPATLWSSRRCCWPPASWSPSRRCWPAATRSPSPASSWPRPPWAPSRSAFLLDGVPAALPSPISTAAMIGLAIGGTLVPFTLFAWAQARISPEIAGAFLNLEPLVGVVLGVAGLPRPARPGPAGRSRSHPGRHRPERHEPCTPQPRTPPPRPTPQPGTRPLHTPQPGTRPLHTPQPGTRQLPTPRAGSGPLRTLRISSAATRRRLASPLPSSLQPATVQARTPRAHKTLAGTH